MYFICDNNRSDNNNTCNEGGIGRGETDCARQHLSEVSKYHESDNSSRFYEALRRVNILCNRIIIFYSLMAFCRYILSTLKLILADTSKFKKIQIDHSKVLHHLIHVENKIVELLKRLKGKKLLIESTIPYTFKARYF